MAIAPYFTLTGILTGVPPGTALPAGKYVYQKTTKGLGNVPGDRTKRQQIRIWVTGTPSNTPEQIYYRSIFAFAVAKWHTLSEPEKEAYRVPAEKLKLNRFQLFMKTYCRAAALQTATKWDAGTTQWDSGATIWPLPE